MRTTLLVGVVVAMFEASSSAQVAPEAAAPDPAASPGFVTLDRGDASSRAGGELSYMILNTSTPGVSTTPLRFDVHGQYVDRSGFGGYAQLPISYLRSSGGGVSNSSTGVGDAEVGGLYIARVNPNVAAALRLGLTLPTASSDRNAEVANLIGELTRLTDLYEFVPKGTSLRISVSPMLRQGQLFARLDLGLDANISADSSVTNVDNVVRVCAGVGYESGTVAVTAEVTNLHSSKAGGGSTGSAWIDAGAVGVRVNAGSVLPYGAIVFPLDHDSHQFMSAAFTVGAEGRLR